MWGRNKGLVLKNGSKKASDDIGVDGCVIFKWILNKRGGRGLDLSGPV